VNVKLHPPRSRLPGSPLFLKEVCFFEPCCPRFPQLLFGLLLPNCFFIPAGWGPAPARPVQHPKCRRLYHSMFFQGSVLFLVPIRHPSIVLRFDPFLLTFRHLFSSRCVFFLTRGWGGNISFLTRSPFPPLSNSLPQK